MSNDVAKVSPERAISAALLTAQGRFLHDFFIAPWQDGVVIDCERERQADLVKRLKLYRLRAKVQFTDLNTSHDVLLLWDDPHTGAAGAVTPFANSLAYVDPRNAGLGRRAIVAKGFVPDQAPGRAEDYTQLRLSLGVPDGSRDLEVEKALLLENGFEALNGVDFDKGCYVGQEITARTKYRGLGKRRLVKVTGDVSLPPPGTPILQDGAEAGVMRTSQGTLGLALLRLDALEKPAPFAADGVLLRQA